MGRKCRIAFLLAAWIFLSLAGCGTAAPPDPQETVPGASETLERTDSTVQTEETTERTEPVTGTEPGTEEATSTTVEAPSSAESRQLEGISIGLDPGHQRYGNSEQEAIAPGSTETKNKVTGGAVGVATGIPEYVTVLEISELIRDKLEAQGATVYMTRETHDVDISNQERTRMMNDYGVDLMLRIHCDSSDDPSKNGCALYVSQSNAIAQQSRAYAELILPAICEATAAKNNGIVQNDNYTGQNWAEVPCIMIECGFLSDPEEDKLLNSAEHQEKVAEGIVNGILDCFSERTETPSLPTDPAAEDVLTPHLDASGVDASALAGHRQLVVVQSEGTNATVYCMEAIDGIWQQCSKVDGVVGQNGVSSEAREGLKYTPKGLYPLGFAFGTQALDDLSIEYRQTDPDCYWVDDPESPLYDQWVESKDVTWKSAEHLADYAKSYKYSVVIEYNMDPIVPYAGSAFFLHCMTGPSTAGCVAVPEEEMLQILRWLDDAKDPMILIY